MPHILCGIFFYPLKRQISAMAKRQPAAKRAAKRAAGGPTITPPTDREVLQALVLSLVQPVLETFWGHSRTAIQNEMARCAIVYNLYQTLQGSLQSDQVGRWFRWACTHSLGLTTPMATKMYAAHVLWARAIHRDVEQLIAPNVLTAIAHKAVVHDGLKPGWSGRPADLAVGRRWVTQFMRYVHTAGIANEKYAHGRYLTLASFLRASDWARQEHRTLTRSVTRARTLSQLGLSDTRRESAATGMQLLLIDKTGTMSPAAMRQEAAYRCSNSEKFEFVELL